MQRELVEGFDMISLNAGKKAVSVFAAVVLSFSMVPTYAWGSTSEGETSDADIHSASNGISNNQAVPFSSDSGVDDVLADGGQEGRWVAKFRGDAGPKWRRLELYGRRVER